MLETEISDKLKNIKFFIGVFARDELPETSGVFPQSLVVNTDPRSQTGTHWVGIYIDENGKADYFDSYGLPPMCIEFLNYLESNAIKGFKYNRITLQCTTCVTCGEYVCAYLILRTAGIKHREFVQLFTTNLENNDKIIKSIFNVINEKSNKIFIKNKLLKYSKTFNNS